MGDNNSDLFKNLQSRKWLLTVNNPSEKGYSHEFIKKALNELKVAYWCMSDETGESGTYHTHIYMYIPYVGKCLCTSCRTASYSDSKKCL